MGKIAGKTVEEWIKNYPLIKQMISTEEVFWTNPKYGTFEEAMKHIYLSEKDVKEAEQRLQRFSSYIAQVFPETKEMNGIIESPTVEIPHMQKKLESKMKKIEGRFLLKCDSHLAISGSIKARGGIYEVLKHAEDLAIEANMLTFNDDYSMINSERFRKFYSQYSIVVGSTGNLGLSIGIMSAKLGFNVTVHIC